MTSHAADTISYTVCNTWVCNRNLYFQTQQVYIKMDPPRNIFWGLVVKANKRYETEVQEAFRITKVKKI
jgi:hypothetical protein